MSIKIDLSEPHEMMLEELRDKHGKDEIDDYLTTVVSNEIHESYQQLTDTE